MSHLADSTASKPAKGTSGADVLLERQGRIEKRLAARHLEKGQQVLYDVSSSYYEGHTCALVQFGHSRDGKRGKPIRTVPHSSWIRCLPRFRRAPLS